MDKKHENMMRAVGLGLFLLGLSACAPTALPVPPAGPGPAAQAAFGQDLPPDAAVRNFVLAVDRVEPVAEALCRRANPRANCDFNIVVDGRRGQPPNAFQSLDPQGRPVIGFTQALIEGARNIDEIAFVLGHETSHHILGHLPLQQQSAQQGALLAGLLVAVGGGGQADIDRAVKVGGEIGARRYSKDFELEADALGTRITLEAGFDPLNGAAFFTRIPDPGDQFLGTHPPNAARLDTVRRVVAQAR